MSASTSASSTTRRPSPLAGAPATPSAAIADLIKKTNVEVQKLDKKHDGFIDEADMKPLMKRLEKTTKKMESSNPGIDGDLESASVRAALANSRKSMKDSERILMLIAQAAAGMTEEGQEKVSVKAVQAAVKKQVQTMVKSLKSDAGGLMGGLEKMFAFILLPDEVLEAALGRPLASPVAAPSPVDTFDR